MFHGVYWLCGKKEFFKICLILSNNFLIFLPDFSMGKLKFCDPQKNDTFSKNPEKKFVVNTYNNLFHTIPLWLSPVEVDNIVLVPRYTFDRFHLCFDTSTDLSFLVIFWCICALIPVLTFFWWLLFWWLLFCLIFWLLLCLIFWLLFFFSSFQRGNWVFMTLKKWPTNETKKD